MLTGLYPHQTGAIDNTDTLDWRFRTMFHPFSDQDYLTALIGKMHFRDAHNHGLEYYLSINDWLMFLGPKVSCYANEIANHPLDTWFFGNMIDDGSGFPDVADLWAGPSPWVGKVNPWDSSDMASQIEPEDQLDMFIARETVKFLRRYRQQPFFLVAGFMRPHPPLHPPRPWAGRYPVDRIELPDIGDIDQYPEHIRQRIKRYQELGDDLLRATRAGYLGNLSFVDHCIGHVTGALEELGLAENTIVVYTSDHGEMSGDHGLYGKFCLFEPAVRVPLIVSYPKELPQGKVADALTEYIGLYPTLVELSGVEAPRNTFVAKMKGAPAQIAANSFAPIARNPELDGPEAIFSEYNLRGKVCQYMVRTQRYKLIYNQGSTHELYDEQEDPQETINRIDDPHLSSDRNELQDRLLAWFDPAANPYRCKG